MLSVCTTPPSPLPYPLAGVIATSPLLLQRHPASKFVRKIGDVVGRLSPWTTLPAAINPQVCDEMFGRLQLLTNPRL